MGQIKYHAVVLVGNNKGWLTLKAVISWQSRDKLNGQAFVCSKLVNGQEQHIQLLIRKTWHNLGIKVLKRGPSSSPEAGKMLSAYPGPVQELKAIKTSRNDIWIGAEVC